MGRHRKVTPNRFYSNQLLGGDPRSGTKVLYATSIAAGVGLASLLGSGIATANADAFGRGGFAERPGASSTGGGDGGPSGGSTVGNGRTGMTGTGFKATRVGGARSATGDNADRGRAGANADASPGGGDGTPSRPRINIVRAIGNLAGGGGGAADDGPKVAVNGQTSDGPLAAAAGDRLNGSANDAGESGLGADRGVFGGNEGSQRQSNQGLLSGFLGNGDILTRDFSRWTDFGPPGRPSPRGDLTDVVQKLQRIGRLIAGLG